MSDTDNTGRGKYYLLAVLAMSFYVFAKVGARAVRYFHRAGYISEESAWFLRHCWPVVPIAAHAGIAVWLYYEASRDDNKPWLWALFGIVFGIPALVIYMLLRVNGVFNNNGNPEKRGSYEP